MQSSSLSWQLLPENLEDLPMEIETDTLGYWSELWLRSQDNPQSQPRSFMEQSLGVRWLGMNPDKTGKPSRVLLIFAERSIVDILGDKVRTGKIDANGEKISWQDGTKDTMVGFKKRGGRRKRQRSAKKINFGKVVLPPIASHVKDITPWALDGLDEFLAKIPVGTENVWTSRDLTLLYKMNDHRGSLLKYRFGTNCSEDDKDQLENIIEQNIEPKLTCWVSQNPERGMLLVSALLQRPELECKMKPVAGEGDVCGKASFPVAESFFITSPKISLNMSKCKEEIGPNLLHETFHLVGIKDGEEMEKALTQSESCSSSPASLTFENNPEEFFNDLQVETRILLFRKVREEATDKWGWTESEKAYVLGNICTKMGDKFCSRRFFQLASEAGNTQGMIPLPEGGEVSFSAAVHFGLFDSITEDLPRMHEMVKYLSRDPNGTLLRRLETGAHRMHEFFVARSALEQIKNNKGICNSETDDRVGCEDLSQIVKSPWFKNP